MSPAESAARLRPGKALRVYSFPKAGRTWLSHLWFHYASVLAGRSDLTREAAGSVRSFWRPTQDPRFQAEVRDVLHARGLGSLTFSHAFSPLDGPSEVAAKLTRRHAVVIRRPASILISYFHHTRSRKDFNFKNLEWIEQASAAFDRPDELVYSHQFGIGAIVAYYRQFDAPADHRLVVAYEDMVADTRAGFRALLNHAGHESVSETALDAAVEACRFERLQAEERAVRDREGIPPEAGFRFRRGSPAVPDAELSPAALAYIDQRLRDANVGLLNRYVPA